MVTKIITFPPEYIKRKKQSLLSSLILAALPEARTRQNKGNFFARKDTIGSFRFLMKARLVERKEIRMRELTRLKKSATLSSILLFNIKSSINLTKKT